MGVPTTLQPIDRGRATVPASVREALGIETGEEAVVRADIELLDDQDGVGPVPAIMAVDGDGRVTIPAVVRELLGFRGERPDLAIEFERVDLDVGESEISMTIRWTDNGRTFIGQDVRDLLDVGDAPAFAEVTIERIIKEDEPA